MANRKITEMPSIEGGSIVDEDLLTVVAVNEADPSLRNKKFQFDELVVYLDQYFQNTSGNTFSGDIIVGGNATISGLTTTSGLTVTHDATVSGLTVQDDAIVSGTISGGIVSGNTSSFNQSEIQIGTIVTLTGTTFTYSTGIVTSFFSGAVITGDTINALNFATSNFTAAYISGGTVTGISGEFGTLTAQSVTLSGVTVTDALTVSGALGVSGLLTASGAYITGTITGNTITGNSIYGTSGIFTYVSGTTITGDLISVTSGVYAHVSGATITGNNISGAGGQFAHLSGATITGDAVSATVVTGVSGVFTNISGTSGVFTNITGTNIQANRMDVETGVFQDLTAVNMTFQGDQTISGNFTVLENQVISGNLRVVGNITGESNLIIEQTGFIENIVSSGIISGSTINGNLVQANSGVYTYLSGATITGDLISGTSGVYTYLSGATITGDLVSGTSGVFTNLSGSTITGDTIQATSGIFVTGSFTDLEISGLILSTGLFASGTESEPSITFVDDTNTGFYNAAANEVRVTTNGNDRLTVDSAGNVGIGTSDPQTQLTVRGSTPRITLEPTADTQNCRLQFTTTDGTIQSTIQAGGVLGSQISFVQSSSESMRIDSDGRLLVGTTSNNGVDANLVVKNSNSKIETTFDNEFAYTSLFTKSRNGGIVQNNDALGNISFLGHDGVDLNTYAAIISAAVDGTPGADDMPGRLVFSTTGSGESSPTERFRITSEGRVGIGTTDPQAALDINAAASTSPFIASVNGNEKLRIDNTRLLVGLSSSINVGSTNTSSSPGIQVQSDSTQILTGVSDKDSNGGPQIALGKSRDGAAVVDDDYLAQFKFSGHDGTDYTTNGARIDVRVDGSVATGSVPARFEFRTAAVGETSTSTRMTIGSDGKVGIGSTNPQADLTVSDSGAGGLEFNANWLGSGSAAISAFNRDTDSRINLAITSQDTIFFGGGTERVRITSDGNVGIGTDAPVTKLQVNGNLTVGPVNTTDQYQGILIVNGKDSSSAETISFVDGRNDLGTADSSIWMAHETDGGSYIRFDTTPAGNRNTDRRTERLRIDSDGNVGIGVSSPTEKLEIDGSVIIKRNITASNTVLRLGTNGTTDAYLQYENTATNGTGVLNISTTNTYAEINTKSTRPLVLNADAGGNVGIGTTSPGDKLTVNGTAAANNFKETVFTITWSSGFALNPGNGGTQFVVLGGNSTPTQSNWDNGESITLHIDDGSSRTITWTTLGVVWTGGSAPTLATSGDTVVQLWKAGNVIYGALVGEVA